GSTATGTDVGRVKLVHANDSVLGCGSKRDRHEAIGAGMIGTAPFRELLAALPCVPFVVGTPGEKAGHARDIATLKELRAAGEPGCRAGGGGTRSSAGRLQRGSRGLPAEIGAPRWL